MSCREELILAHDAIFKEHFFIFSLACLAGQIVHLKYLPALLFHVFSDVSCPRPTDLFCSITIPVPAQVIIVCVEVVECVFSSLWY